MLTSKLCETFGVKYPIILAGMAYISQPELAAAVSNAGALGTLRGPVAGEQVERLLEDIKRVKALTDKPFGVDLIFPTVAEETRDEWEYRVKRQIEIVCEEKPTYIIAGLGNPGPAMPQLHAQGIKVMALAGNVKHALRHEAAGCDFVIAQGHEAGGHTGRITALTLVPQVVDAVKVPVVAAGGIADPRQMVAAFILGACGVLMGTRFIATYEANAHPHYKDRIVEVGDEGTVVTKAYSGKPCRVIRNKFTDEWAKRDSEILPYPLQQEKLKEIYHYDIYMVGGQAVDGPGDTEMGFCGAGQGSGLIGSLKSAGEVIEEMMEGAERILEEVERRLNP